MSDTIGKGFRFGCGLILAFLLVFVVVPIAFRLLIAGLRYYWMEQFE